MVLDDTPIIIIDRPATQTANQNITFNAEFFIASLRRGHECKNQFRLTQKNCLKLYKKVNW